MPASAVKYLREPGTGQENLGLGGSHSKNQDLSFIRHFGKAYPTLLGLLGSPDSIPTPKKGPGGEKRKEELDFCSRGALQHWFGVLVLSQS